MVKKSLLKPASKNILESDAKLIQQAQAVRLLAYAPYSNFYVGAALQAKNGQIFLGNNVENRSYGLTICAERNAVAQAVAVGVRDFERIVIATNLQDPAPPCGACREVLSEFCQDLEVILVGQKNRVVVYRLADLLPHHFVLSKSKKNVVKKKSAKLR